MSYALGLSPATVTYDGNTRTTTFIDPNDMTFVEKVRIIIGQLLAAVAPYREPGTPIVQTAHRLLVENHEIALNNDADMLAFYSNWQAWTQGLGPRDPVFDEAIDAASRIIAESQGGYFDPRYSESYTPSDEVFEVGPHFVNTPGGPAEVELDETGQIAHYITPVWLWPGNGYSVTQYVPPGGDATAQPYDSGEPAALKANEIGVPVAYFDSIGRVLWAMPGTLVGVDIHGRPIEETEKASVTTVEPEPITTRTMFQPSPLTIGLLAAAALLLIPGKRR